MNKIIATQIRDIVSKQQAAPVESTVERLVRCLSAIVNTAQKNPDRCMANVCNDNFAVHGINLRAEMSGSDDCPVWIEHTSNEQG